jgi:hypothetical protein
MPDLSYGNSNLNNEIPPMKIYHPIVFCMVALVLFSASPAGAADARWISTNYWSAGGDTNTRMVDVLSEEWQIHYVNRDTGTLIIQVVNESGQTVDKPIMADRPIRGIHSFKGPGRFYLKVTGTSQRWQINLRQKLTRLQEWDLRQKNEAQTGRWDKVASFTGENGRETYPINIKGGSWKFAYQNGTGEVNLRVLDAKNGDVLFQRTITRPEKAESWIHQSGEFYIEVDALESAWRVDVFAPGAGSPLP